MSIEWYAPERKHRATEPLFSITAARPKGGRSARFNRAAMSLFPAEAVAVRIGFDADTGSIYFEPRSKSSAETIKLAWVVRRNRAEGATLGGTGLARAWQLPLTRLEWTLERQGGLIVGTARESGGTR